MTKGNTRISKIRSQKKRVSAHEQQLKALAIEEFNKRLKHPPSSLRPSNRLALQRIAAYAIMSAKAKLNTRTRKTQKSHTDRGRISAATPISTPEPESMPNDISVSVNISSPDPLAFLLPNEKAILSDLTKSEITDVHSYHPPPVPTQASSDGFFNLESDDVGNTQQAQQQEELEHRLLSAKEQLIQWINRENNQVSKEELNAMLESLQQRYQLTRAYLDDSEQGIFLTINPTLFIPVKAKIISGERTNPQTAIPAGDYLRATHYDGPFPTPISEIITKWNNLNETAGTKLTSNQINLSDAQKKTISGSSYRPGSVEAVSSITRGPNRSGSGETAIGHIGNQQQLIMTGQRNADFNGGHLVGDQLINSHKNFSLYETWNLAPQHRDFNSPIYSNAMEAAATAATNQGNPIKYNVTVKYDKSEEQIPIDQLSRNILTQADYSALPNQLKNSKTVLNFHTRIPRYWLATAEEVNAPGNMGGTVSSKGGGTLSNSQVNEQNSVPNGSQFFYSVTTTAGGQDTTLQNTGQKQKFSGASKIRIAAVQKTYI